MQIRDEDTEMEDKGDEGDEGEGEGSRRGLGMKDVGRWRGGFLDSSEMKTLNVLSRGHCRRALSCFRGQELSCHALHYRAPSPAQTCHASWEQPCYSLIELSLQLDGVCCWPVHGFPRWPFVAGHR